ncbi:hypothetical protein AOQ84DRAFT_44857 [Glonium stellatum]|uniref:Uncharacterized protein n=1 Tax=Glonium stellatum TaxID=574774 RepID=A0A8E2F0X3_9PEZI|nr:hypothetical protein AOQ84DRAFT_44857 [Glonium stellatum]
MPGRMTDLYLNHRLRPVLAGHSAFYVYNFLRMTNDYEFMVLIHNLEDPLKSPPYWKPLRSLVSHDRADYLSPTRRHQSRVSNNPAHAAWYHQIEQDSANYISPLHFKEFRLLDGGHLVWPMSAVPATTEQMIFNDCYLSTPAQVMGFLYHKSKTHLFSISDFYVSFNYGKSTGRPIRVARLPLRNEIWFQEAFSPNSALRSIVRFEDDVVVWDSKLKIDMILGTGDPKRRAIFPRNRLWL